MRVRVTNLGRREGSLLIDGGDPEDDRPPRLKKLAGGKSVELRITQRGQLTVVGFKARVIPLARNPKVPTRQTAQERREGGEKKHV
jgi:hypothetical protein